MTCCGDASSTAARAPEPWSAIHAVRFDGHSSVPAVGSPTGLAPDKSGYGPRPERPRVRVPSEPFDHNAGPFNSDDVARIHFASPPRRGGGSGLHKQHRMTFDFVALGAARRVSYMMVPGQNEVHATTDQRSYSHVGTTDHRIGRGRRRQIKRVVGHQDADGPVGGHVEALTSTLDLPLVDP